MRVLGFQFTNAVPSPRGQTDRAHSFDWAPVQRLLAARCPSAVLGRVRAIVVDAIKAVLRSGSFTHVGDKLREIVPTGIDRNTAPSPIRIAGIVPVIAASTHLGPNRIQRMVTTTWGKAMRVAPETSAGLDATFREMVSPDRHEAATITATQPCGSAIVGRGLLKCQQSSETLARKVKPLSHYRQVTRWSGDLWVIQATT